MSMSVAVPYQSGDVSISLRLMFRWSDLVNKQISLKIAISAGLSTSMLLLAGCPWQSSNNGNAPAASSSAPASSSTAAGQQAQAYTPPTADQLYQLVAPIALFPDKLVAQVLAGSTYPDQVTAAENLLTQNPNLKGDLLQAAVTPQAWDPSVKGLTQFPPVLSQMAQNIQWTQSLGEAYVNDPTDVLNAIQVMRQRASAQGNLRTSAQQQVTTQPAQQVAQSEQASGYVDNGSAPPVYSGDPVVPPPQQIYQIEPAQPDAVYVPVYNPQTVYGGDVAYYPGYDYPPPQPSYNTGEVIAVGAVAFTAAIVVGAMFEHGGGGGGGWHSWGMNWGGGRGGYNGGGGGGWHRPAVVYNNQTYVSRSTTVVNRYTVNNTTINNNNNYANNRTINNSNVTNNQFNRNVANNEFNRNATNNVTNNQFNHNVANTNRAPGQPMSVPNFGHSANLAQAPHAAPEARPVPNISHQAPAQIAHPVAAAPHAPEAFRQPAAAAHAVPPSHPQPAAHAAPQPHPQPVPAFHPQAQPRPQPAAAHPQPAFHPEAQQPHPQPAPHPAPAPRPAPQPQQHAAPQAHPQPPAHPAPPPKKKDDHSHD
jgi:hypothetical protein